PEKPAMERSIRGLARQFRGSSRARVPDRRDAAGPILLGFPRTFGHVVGATSGSDLPSGNRPAEIACRVGRWRRARERCTPAATVHGRWHNTVYATIISER